MKPFLLLDIDGVLSPFGKGRIELEPIVGHEFAKFNPANIEDLKQLAEVFELVWGTMWENEANEVLGPALELPELPFINFGRTKYTSWLMKEPLGKTFKLPAVKEFVGDRPVAWIDDDLWSDAKEWAHHRNEKIPTRLFHTSPHVGMNSDMVENMLEWGRQVNERINK